MTIPGDTPTGRVPYRFGPAPRSERPPAQAIRATAPSGPLRSFFAPIALALLIGGAQCHHEQHPDGLGTRGMAGLLAAPFINRLLALHLQSKTENWGLPTPRTAALFSYYKI